MLKLAGVDHYSNVTTGKGRHVEFVSVDFCKVFRAFTILVVLMLFERSSIFGQRSFLSCGMYYSAETGSTLEEMLLKSYYSRRRYNL